MKHQSIITLALCAAGVLTAASQDVTELQRQLVSEQSITPIKAKTPTAENSTPAITIKKIPGKKRTGNVVNPAAVRKSAAAPSRSQSEVALFESFETRYPNDYTWLPKGWTRKVEGTGTLTNLNKWFAYNPSTSGVMSAAAGQYVMSIFPADGGQDAWLISPEITVTEGMDLTFYAYYQPFYFFEGGTDKIDYENMVFIGEPVVANTLKVMIKAEDGDWKEILDVSDKYIGKTMLELFDENPTSMVRHDVSLRAYDNKKIQVAFRYINTDDGDTMFLDAVTVGYPALDEVSFDQPWETLFWGYDRQPGWGFVNAAVAHYPVYSPITWTNTSPYDSNSVGYTWKYNTNPKPEQWATSNDPESLTVTYKPNYTDEATTRNNLYYPPTLTATGNGYTSSTFKPAYSFFQAGGEAVMGETADDKSMKLGLLPFSPITDGLSFLSREIVWGEPVTPYCGTSPYTDMIWFNETFPGEDPSTGEYDTYVDGVLNFIYPASSPLVLEGAHLLAYSRHKEDAELTLELYYLGDDYILDLDDPVSSGKQLMASASCKASDFITEEGTNYAELTTIPFDFDKPVILDRSHTAYVVLVKGFHSDKFDYFAAMQSQAVHPDGMNFSYLVKHNLFNNVWSTSLFPLAYLESDNGPCYNAFAINLLATYPYLESETTEASVPCTVKLDSYYPAEQLTLSNIAGVEATVSGRYGETLLTLNRNAADVTVDGTLEITAPGVSHKIKLTEGGSSITEISSDTSGKEVDKVYTLTGAPVNPTGLLPGIYVVRYTDGTSGKIAVN